MRKRNSLLMLVSVSVAFFAVIIYTYAATTISTAIDTGGALTVAGATALNGGLTMDSSAFTIADTSGNTAIAGTLNVTGAVWATSTLQVTGAATFYNTVTISGAKGLVLGNSSANPSGNTAGMIYYNTTSAVIKMNDGASWFTVGTSTSGWSLTSPRLYPSDVSYYLTVGTSTQQGLSVLTLEATTTTAIPLTIRGFTGQTANLLQVANSASTNLLYITSGGNVFATGTLQVTGALTTYGATTIGDEAGDALTIGAGAWTFSNTATSTVAMTNGLKFDTSTFVIDPNSNRIGILTITPNTALEVVGVASSTQLVVGGGTTISNIVFGTCALAQTTITASSTAIASCTSATGIVTTHEIFVTPTANLNNGFVITAASSTSAGAISLYIRNEGYNGTTSTSVAASITLNFLGIK